MNTSLLKQIIYRYEYLTHDNRMTNKSIIKYLKRDTVVLNKMFIEIVYG